MSGSSVIIPKPNLQFVFQFLMQLLDVFVSFVFFILRRGKRTEVLKKPLKMKEERKFFSFLKPDRVDGMTKVKAEGLILNTKLKV